MYNLGKCLPRPAWLGPFMPLVTCREWHLLKTPKGAVPAEGTLAAARLHLQEHLLFHVQWGIQGVPSPTEAQQQAGQGAGAGSKALAEALALTQVGWVAGQGLQLWSSTGWVSYQAATGDS